MSRKKCPFTKSGPRKDKRGVDLISDALPFGRLWYLQVSDAIDYAKHRSRSHDAVIRVYDDAGNVIETHEHAKDNVVPFCSDQVVSAFTHVVLCPAGPPKVHMGKVSPTLIDITLSVCVWQ